MDRDRYEGGGGGFRGGRRRSATTAASAERSSKRNVGGAVGDASRHCSIGRDARRHFRRVGVNLICESKREIQNS